jgi:hypothetical protein
MTPQEAHHIVSAEKKVYRKKSDEQLKNISQKKQYTQKPTTNLLTN